MFIEPELTEEGWLAASDWYDAEWMLRRLWWDTTGRRVEATLPTPRKSRLSACACARAIWSDMPDDNCRIGVEVAERHIEGEATLAESLAASEAIFDRLEPLLGTETDRRLESAYTLSWMAAAPVFTAHDGREERSTVDRSEDWKVLYHLRRLAPTGFNPADLLRCIFGNPFRPVTVDPCWLTSTAVAIAKTIYEERAFDRLPILADALEDAGCDEPALLDHCRSDGTHVRGCWAVDLVLGKQ